MVHSCTDIRVDQSASFQKRNNEDTGICDNYACFGDKPGNVSAPRFWKICRKLLSLPWVNCLPWVNFKSPIHKRRIQRKACWIWKKIQKSPLHSHEHEGKHISELAKYRRENTLSTSAKLFSFNLLFKFLSKVLFLYDFLLE